MRVLGWLAIANGRMRRTRGAMIVLACALVAPGIAAAGEFGIPCDPGSFSANGFEPCTACAPGTFSAFDGAIQCEMCPAGSFTSMSGSSLCVPCQCNDNTTCTIDGCNAVTAACTVEPVATCEPLAIYFEGTVTSIGLSSAQPSAFFSLGMPMEGRFVLDPLAPDAEPISTTLGTFPGAVVDFEVRVGTGANAFDTTGSGGSWLLFNDYGENGDMYQLLVKGPAFEGPPLPGATRHQFLLYLRDESANTPLSSDVPPTAIPDPAAWEFAELQFWMIEDLAGTTAAYSANFVLSAPEPAAGGATLAAACLALARWRRLARS
jgi:hypothetical protein